jgi:ligand-binding sensor domain-containing protein/signal transduction histidine kinase
MRAPSTLITLRPIAAPVAAALLIGLLLTTASTIYAQQLPVRIYATADGLAHDHVRRIVLDSRGFLWFCTMEGLNRFDGQRFIEYSTRDGLGSAQVFDVLETRDGDYWVATEAGVSRFGRARINQDRAVHAPAGPAKLFTNYVVGTGAANIANVLHQDRAGRIVVGTDDGVVQIEQAPDGRVTFRKLDLGLKTAGNDTLRIRAFLEDREGSLWIGTSRGVVRRLPGGEMVEHQLAPTGQPDYVRALLQDKDGRIWVGHKFGLIAFMPESHTAVAVRQALPPSRFVARDVGRLSQARPVPLPEAPGAAYRYDATIGRKGVRDVHASPDGELWFAQTNGLGHLEAGRFRVYSVDHGITGDAINVITPDANGSLWIGTDTNGASRLERNGFTTYSIEKREQRGWVVSISEDRQGTLFAVDGQTGAINFFQNDQFVPVQPNVPARVAVASRGFPRTAIEDHLGDWWVPTVEGLYRFPRVEDVRQLAHVRPRAVYTTRDGLTGDRVYHAFEDSRGDIWLGTNPSGQDVVTQWQRKTGSFRRYSTADGLRTATDVHFAAANAFAEDAAGNVWIGFAGGGLARVASGVFTFFTAADGLAADELRQLFVDSRGRLWIGSHTGGVSRADSPDAARPQFRTYTVRDGLASDSVRSISEDRWGRIHLGTARGVDRLDPETGRIRHFTTADGLTNNEIESAFRDRRGALWFGTLNGVSRFVPQLEGPPQPPGILIDELRIAGAAFPLPELGASAITTQALEARQNSLQIDVLSLGARVGGNRRYQYRLEGADGEWSEPTATRTIFYSNLAPGRYRFSARAIDADDQVSATPAAVSFQILPPIWQRWWFVTAALLAVGVAAHALHRHRVRRLLELERVRTRIATDLHDDIGSSLSQIAILSEVVRQRVGSHEESVREPLSQITGASSELMDAMSDIVWAIDPRKDHLSDLTQRMRRFSSDVFTARQIAFEFHAPEAARDIELGADVRRQVFLIFKESVNNIVRHSNCSQASIAFSASRERITLRITDNGTGFDTERQWDGHGLSSMRKRTQELGGTLQVVGKDVGGTLVTLQVAGSGHIVA